MPVCWQSCKMASEKPGSIEQAPQPQQSTEAQQTNQALEELEQTLLSMEHMDRTSPDLWPEKYPDVAEFINNFTPPSAMKLPYSRELNPEDQNYLQQLAALQTAGLISKVKELHDIAYQLGLEESKEVTRGKFLNLFKSKIHK